jgi:hypothetical protein
MVRVKKKFNKKTLNYHWNKAKISTFLIHLSVVLKILSKLILITLRTNNKMKEWASNLEFLIEL